MGEHLQLLHEDLVARYQQLLREGIVSFATENNFNAISVGDSIKTIIIGEEHRTYTKEIANFIRKIRPGLVLDEGFTAYAYDPKEDQIYLQKGRMAYQSEHERWEGLLERNETDRVGSIPLLQAAVDLKFSILGLDLSFGEEMEHIKRAYSKKIRRKLDRLLDVGDEAYLSYFDMLTKPIRDQHMLQAVKANLGGPTNPTVVITGFMHALDMMTSTEITNFAIIGAIPAEIQEIAYQQHIRRQRKKK